jgi:hypothetical protein
MLLKFNQSFLKRLSWYFLAMFCSASLVALVVYLIAANHNKYPGALGSAILVSPGKIQLRGRKFKNLDKKTQVREQALDRSPLACALLRSESIPSPQLDGCGGPWVSCGLCSLNWSSLSTDVPLVKVEKLSGMAGIPA